MNKFKSSKKQSVSRFRYAVHLISLIFFASLYPAQAQDVTKIAQAKDLTPTPGTAKNLNNGTYPLVVNLDTVAQKPATVPTSPTTPTTEDDDNEPVDILEEVQVVGQRRRITERERTATTFTVDKTQIQALGAKTVADALKLAPGFNFQGISGLASDRAVTVRGLDSRRFIFLIDGRPTARPSDGRAADIGRTGVANIERIEITTGGAGLKYSADAVAGVINVITRIPAGPPKLNVSVSEGSFNFAQYQLDYSGSNGKDPDGAGYIAYELGFDHQSATNDYYGTFNQNKIGAYIGGFGTINGNTTLNSAQVGSFQAPRNPDGTIATVPVVVAGGSPDNPNIALVPDITNVSINNLYRGLYYSNDFYSGKLIYKPAKEHTLTLDVSQKRTTSGNPYATQNLGSCYVVPQNYDYNASAGLVTQSSPQPTYTKCSTFPSTISPTGQPFIAPLDPNTYGAYDQTEDTTSVNLVWDWQLTPTSILTTQTSYSGAYSYAKLANPTLGFNDYGVSNRVYDTQIRYTSELYPGNTFNTGFQFTSLRFNSAIFYPFPVPSTNIGIADREISRWAIYATEDLKFFGDAVILNLGTRLTDDVKFGTFVTSGAGIRLNLLGPPGQEFLGLRANWNQTFKAPGLSQLYGFSPISAIFQSGVASGTPRPNSGLIPETGVGYDLGLDLRFSPSMNFRATYYRVDIANALLENVSIGNYNVTTDPANNNNPQPVFTTVNAQSLLSSGWEFSFNWQIDPSWNLLVTHNINDVRPVGNPNLDFVIDPQPTSPTFGQSIPSQALFNGGYFYDYQLVDTPFFNSVLSLQYTSPGFNATLSGQWVGQRPRALGGNYYYPDYSKWDFTFRVPVSQTVTFTGGVFNIFNDRSVLGDSTLLIGGGVVSPPTTFRVGVDMVFDGPISTDDPDQSTEAQQLRSQYRLPVSDLIADRPAATPGYVLSTPTAFGARGGDFFVGVGFQGRERFSASRANGIVTAGFGLFDPVHFVGLEVSTSLLGLVSNEISLPTPISGNPGIINPPSQLNQLARAQPLAYQQGLGSAGLINFKLHRQLADDTAVAVGVEGLIDWGITGGGNSFYGVITQRLPFFDADNSPKTARDFLSQVTFSAGIGNGRFRSTNDINNKIESYNFFGSMGVQLFEPLSFITDWTGQDLNLGFSWVPLRNLPLVVTPSLVDVTGSAGDGSRFAIGVGYGFSF